MYACVCVCVRVGCTRGLLWNMSFILPPMGATAMAQQGQQWLMGTEFSLCIPGSDVEAPWGVGGVGGE